MATIDYSYLLGLYGVSTSSLGISGGATAVRKSPTAPWSPAAANTVPTASALVQTALNGRAFIDIDAAKLDVKTANEDYKKLFGLYQGLSALTAVARRADQKNITTLEAARLDKAFQRGMTEVSTFLSKDGFEDVRLARSQFGTEAKGTVGSERSTNAYVTPPLHQGDLGASATALEGEVKFSLSVARAGGTVEIDINLAGMGSTPRSLPNVAAFINARLAAEGLSSRFLTQSLGSEPRTMKIGDRVINLPGQNEKFGWKISADSGEKLTFSADDRSDGVFVLQGSGRTGMSELTKFQTDTGVVGAGSPTVGVGVGDTQFVEGRSVQTALDKGVSAVRASVTGPDGSLYVLAEASATVDGQTIKGERDVVLMKYDSAGALVFTRTLGAADEANATAIAVSDDGRIAITGSVKGVLDKSAVGASATQTDSFVTVFDAAGSELWTHRRGASQDDEATAVTFGPDGLVVVGGRTRSSLTGAMTAGGWDGYLRTFSASGLNTSTQQFGGAGDDGVSALSIEGGVIVTAGAEGGQGMVRRFELQPSGEPLLIQSRSLGALSGSISAVNLEGGRVTVVGTTRNSALDLGTVTRAHSGDSDAFIARFDDDMVADANDRLTYLGGTGSDTGAAAAFSGGKVWITGQQGVTGSDKTLAAQGRLSRIDPESGAIEWDRTLRGEGELVNPTSIAVAQGGASILDRLGLPTGTLEFGVSKRVVDATSARAGDQFHINLGGGRMRTVTVTAEDTFATLAQKITTASQNRLKVDVVKTGTAGISSPGDLDVLKVTLRSGRAEAEIVAGTGGRDVLEALGLNQTVLRGAGSFADDRTAFALNLPGDLAITDKASIKTALTALGEAMKQIQAAYRELTKRDQPASARLTGPMPAYEASQIANYQAALQRLGGG